MVNKKPGRPRIDIPDEVIQDIIYMYTKEKKIDGKIFYMKIYRFSKELYEMGRIDYWISEYYWRKGRGRDLVDKANQVLRHSISGSNKNDDNLIVDTEDAINKHYSGNKQDKEILIQLLRTNENKLINKIKQNDSLKKKLKETTIELDKTKDCLRYWQDVANKYEEILFQWTELSVHSSNPIHNLMTTGNTRTKETEDLLKSVFSEDPLKVFFEMTSIVQVHKQSHSTTDDNDKKKKSTNIVSILDDIDF